MKTQTVATHLDRTTLERFQSLSKTENRSPSQVLAVVLKALLDQSPGARRALFAIDGIADPEERAFAARLVGRSVLKAYEGILDARRAAAEPRTGANEDLVTEEAIEAEAVRMCRPLPRSGSPASASISTCCDRTREPRISASEAPRHPCSSMPSGTGDARPVPSS